MAHSLDPAILCLVDGWEGFLAAAEGHDGGRSVEALLTLLRTAASGGVTVLVTGDRSTLLPRVTGVVATRFVFRLADRADYALAGIPPRAVPEVMPPGRALRGDGVEVQLARVRSVADVRTTRAAVAPSTSNAAGKPPMRLRPLPTAVRRADLRAVPAGLRLGLGGHAGDPVSVELFTSSSQLLVAGPPRSGRTTTLHTLLLEALGAGTAVVVAAPPRSDLAVIARQHHLQLFQPRDGATEVADVAPSRRTVLLVDDSEAFADTEVGEALCSLARRAPDHLAVVAAARSDELAMTYRGVAVEARRSRCAVLLQPVPVDGELVGVKLPRRRTLPIPGRGVLIGDVIRSELADGSPMPVQIALP